MGCCLSRPLMINIYLEKVVKGFFEAKDKLRPLEEIANSYEHSQMLKVGKQYWYLNVAALIGLQKESTNEDELW